MLKVQQFSFVCACNRFNGRDSQRAGLRTRRRIGRLYGETRYDCRWLGGTITSLRIPAVRLCFSEGTLGTGTEFVHKAIETELLIIPGIFFR